MRAQLERIYQNSQSVHRTLRAGRAFQRYQDRITSTKSYQRAARNLYNAYERGDFESVRRYSDSASNRQYSRNTYMGNSNG